MDDCKSSQFHEYEQKSIQYKINNSIKYIYIYIYFKLRQVKRFLLKIMGGGLEKAQKQFFGASQVENGKGNHKM